MPREQVNQLQNLGIPFRGMNSQLPAVGLPPEYSIFMNNLRVSNGVIQEREGIRTVYVQGYDGSPDVDVESIGAIVPWSLDGFVGFSSRDTGAPSNQLRAILFAGAGRTTLAFTDGPNVFERYINTCEFMNSVFVFRMGGTPGRYSSGSFALVGFTGPTLSECIGAASYNGRLYVIEAGFSPFNSIWYSPTVGAVSGAFTELPLASLTPAIGQISNIFTFTATAGINAEQLLGVVTEKGFCIIFRGSDPADSSWEVAGSFQIGAPMGVQTWVAADGDILMILESGIMSMRTLMQAGLDAARSSMLTEPIANLWRQVSASIKSNNLVNIYQNYGNRVQATKDDKNNRLIISIPVRIEVNLAGSQIGYTINTLRNQFLVYDFNTAGWSTFTVDNSNQTIPGGGFGGLTYCPNTGQVVFGMRRPYTGSSVSYIRNLNTDVYIDSDEDNADAAIASQIVMGAVYNAKDQRTSAVQLLHQGTAAQKAETQIGLRNNISGSPIYTSIAGSAGASVDLYNIGEQGKFIQLVMNRNPSAAPSPSPSGPYQIGNISLLNQTGGIL